MFPLRRPALAPEQAAPQPEGAHQPLRRMSRRSFMIIALIVVLVVGAILAAIGYVLQFQSLDVLQRKRRERRLLYEGGAHAAGGLGRRGVQGWR